MLKTKLNIRYVSGREEQFEAEILGGTWVEARLKDFVKDPTLVLQTDKEVIVIPSTAIECLSFALPPATGANAIDLPNVRRAKRLK